LEIHKAYVAKHINLTSFVWHTSLMLFHFNTVTTNVNGEGGYLSLRIVVCPFTVLLRAIVFSVLFRCANCNYPLIYFSSYICMMFFTCKSVLLRFTNCNYLPFDIFLLLHLYDLLYPWKIVMLCLICSPQTNKLCS
jgi:hypothetical protein